MTYILIKYIPLFLFLLILWVIRWLPASGQTRRLQLFAVAFSVVVFVAVLGTERLTSGADWLRLTVLGLWLGTALAVFLFRRGERKAVDEGPIFAVVCVFTVALVVILFGVQRLAISSASQHMLGYIVMLIAVLGGTFVGLLGTRRSRTRSETMDSHQQK